MNMNMFDIYDALIEGLPSNLKVKSHVRGKIWTFIELSDLSAGLAMSIDCATRPPLCIGNYDGMNLRDVAALSKSWNFSEAAVGMAAINAWYNEKARAEAAGAAFPEADAGEQDAFAFYLDFARGKKVASIGSFKKIRELYSPLCSLSVIEREPREGEFPDSAAEYLLPEQDIVFITASTLVNKTLPRLLQLSAGAKTVLTGTTAPLAKCLFDFGVDCVAGFVAADTELCRKIAAGGEQRSPSAAGIRVRLKGE